MEDQSTLISENSKVSSVTTTERSSVETDLIDSLSTHKNQNDQLVTSAKAELEDIREENGRLKLVLTQIMKDCQSLQELQEEKTKKYEYAAASSHRQDDEEEPDQLVALSLGRCSLPKSKDLKANNSTKEEDGKCNEGLALRLDGKYDSCDDNSNGVSKKESSGKSINELKESDQEPRDTCSPKKYSSKKARTGDDDEEVTEQNPTKKARVSVRAICSAPTMNDGCQWRKYGQKISKGNPCPRAYYRCTVSPTCPVRKHVQRCAEDLSVLVTTYEGTHNHPLPPSATAMASTTSAAVTMLRSSSITSQSSGLGDTTTSANLHGLNLINTSRPSNIPYYIPNTTSTISSTMSQLHPTITLDLTTPTASSHYNKYASTFVPAPKYSPPCLNFSAANSLSSTSLEYWGAVDSNNKNNLNGCSSYAGLTQAPSQSIPSSSFYQPYYNAINMPTSNNSYCYDQPHPGQNFTDKIAAATKEITSNPSFQSALAAAITSIVGKRAAGAVESSSKVMSSSYNESVGYATSYLNRSVVPSNSQQGNLAFSLPPVFSFSSNYKGPFVPDHPADNGEQTN